MGLLQWILKKRHSREEHEDEAWEELVYERDTLRVHDMQERHKYLEECLNQMADASREIELLSGEYNTVTTYLTDMEEIEQLPEAEKQQLQDVCMKMAALNSEKASFQERKSRMTDSQYKSMLRREEELEEGIEKLEKAEKYQTLIKQDMKRLDSEKSAYHYRRNDLENELLNLRGMAMIILGAIAFCFVLLLILQLALGFDTRPGYLLAGVMAAVVIAVLYFKYTEADKELQSVYHAINRLIQLHNTVKIRYVNNTSLLEYLYAKYDAESSAQLRRLWEQYQVEKEERSKYRKTEMELDVYEEELLKVLTRYKIRQPGRWLNQAAAILDSREMVEIRHELIQQRQSLRKQLDYNKEVAESAKQEIMDLARTYPQYAGEIQKMVDRYEKMY